MRINTFQKLHATAIFWILFGFFTILLSNPTPKASVKSCSDINAHFLVFNFHQSKTPNVPTQRNWIDPTVISESRCHFREIPDFLALVIRLLPSESIIFKSVQALVKVGILDRNTIPVIELSGELNDTKRFVFFGDDKRDYHYSANFKAPSSTQNNITSCPAVSIQSRSNFVKTVASSPFQISPSDWLAARYCGQGLAEWEPFILSEQRRRSLSFFR